MDCNAIKTTNLSKVTVIMPIVIAVIIICTALRLLYIVIQMMHLMEFEVPLKVILSDLLLVQNIHYYCNLIVHWVVLPTFLIVIQRRSVSRLNRLNRFQ